MERPESQIDDLKGRVLAARDRLRLLPSAAPVPGAPDSETGEAWDRLHVLGHLAEMLPYWTRQVRRATTYGEQLGRDEKGRRLRQEAVDKSHRRSEAALRRSVDAGCARLLAFLDRLEDADLGRPIRTVQGQQITLEEALASRLVGHLEEHVEQIESFE